MSTAPANKFLSKAYVDGIYIPSGLLILGCFIVKKDWLPFAVALAAVLGGYKIWSSRKFTLCTRSVAMECILTIYAEETPVLKPTVFQDFELKEKTVISHNVAMSV